MSAPAIEVHDLTVAYRTQPVLWDVDLTLPEGKLVAVVPAEEAGAALEAMRATAVGADAAIIGEIREDPPGIVILNTHFGGNRIVDMLVGDPLPRIC